MSTDSASTSTSTYAPAGKYQTSYTDSTDPLFQLKTKWIEEQDQLKERLILQNQVQELIQFVGGVDLSFIKGDENRACAALVVLSYPDLNVVYEKYQMVSLNVPYIPSFLAFREVDSLVELIKDLCANRPEIMPQVILVDGNGYLHPRGFGLACHLGVVADIPTIGIGKNLFVMDGLTRDLVTDKVQKESLEANTPIALVGDSGTIWGCALANQPGGRRHIYVSQGHKVSLEKATEVAIKCRKYLIPEPIRAADLGSREYIRANYGI